MKILALRKDRTIFMQGRIYYVIMDSRFVDASAPGDALAFMTRTQLEECRDALKDAKEHIWHSPDNLAPHPQSSGPLSQAPKSQLSVGYTEAQARDALDDRIQRVEQALADRDV
jgi:hypothetical protein